LIPCSALSFDDVKEKFRKKFGATDANPRAVIGIDEPMRRGAFEGRW
jgi:hypothetical protein